LSWLDIVLVAVILFGGYQGYRQGFLMALFSLLAIFLGILGAFKLMGLSLIFLSDRFDIDEKILPYVSFAVVFILIVIIVNLIGKMLRASIDRSFLGRVDEAAGAGLGIIKTIFLVSVAVWIVGSLNIDYQPQWAQESKLLPYIAEFAPVVTEWVGELVPAFKDIFG
jgi:membrane protein required for colicin V production